MEAKMDDDVALNIIARILQEPEWDGDTLESIYQFVEATGRSLKTPLCSRCDTEKSPNDMVEYEGIMICVDCLDQEEMTDFIHQVVR